MAVLSDADRQIVSAELQRRVRSNWGGALKTDLQGAVNAADAWADANAAAFNAAIPAGARALLSATDKSVLLAYVVLKRANLL